MTTKLHPSIVLYKRDFNTTTVVVDNVPALTTFPGPAEEYAVEVSGILWSIEVSERPAKPKPTRIWSEYGWDDMA